MTDFLETGRESVLSRFLHMPLTLDHADRKIYAPNSRSRDIVVTSSRLILILQGKMTYSMENKVFNLEAGTQFFVPAWIRRVWTVPRRSICEIVWCEFDDDALEFTEVSCVQRKLRGQVFRQEKKHHLELLKAYRKFNDDGRPKLGLLFLESMLKASLGRFWTQADDKTESSASVPAPFIHPAVKQALRRMERRYMEKDALESIYVECELTPNYFRKSFKESMQCTPQDYLQRLRLRHARHLIHSTPWLQKRIAAEVGYPDPLYFSRLYTRFWGHSPSEERSPPKPVRGKIKARPNRTGL